MSYKKQSPFASFRDPKRATRNFNPTDFQMPDINSIFNKTADGENVEEPKKEDDTDPKNDINGKLLDNINKNQKEEVEDVTRRSLRRDRRAGEKEFNKELRRVKRLAKANTKDITSEERIKLERAEQAMREEKKFRKEAKKAGINPGDFKNEEGSSGNKYAELSLKTAKKALRKNPEDRAQIADQFGYERGYKGDVYDKLTNSRAYNKILNNYAKQEKKDEKEIEKYGMIGGKQLLKDYNKFTKEQEKEARKKELEALEAKKTNIPEESLRRMMMPGMYNKKENMKQVNSKGSGFPMIQPNQDMAQQQQVPNRAGRSAESNTLTNDPNITQPMNKVPASSFQRNAQFSDIASGQGVPNPQPQQMATTTPPAPIFPQQQQQGSFAAYSNPSRAIDTSSEEIAKGGRKMQESVKDLGDSFSKKEDNKENNKEDNKDNDGVSMYNGPSKALVGNQDRLPEHLKAKIEAAPGMYGNGPSMRSAFKAFENDHLKTKVTKGNLRATERDDAAHMSYLKRDVKYDNTHGGSNRQMLDDEKHISKLAGDLKYDARKKRS